MKKILSILAIAAVMVACSKEDSTTDVAPATYTLTGYSSLGTRTEFGTPGTESIPFLWSNGDMVWIDGIRSSALNCSTPVASATFSVTNSPDDGDEVYYNMKAAFGPNADIADVPASQSTANSLGVNGDFGYATVKNGAFRLNHATSYLWFDIEALPEGYSLNAIRLNAGDAIVAGKAKWDGSKFGTPTNGSSVIDLAVDKDATMVAMVVLPANIETATITYELSKGNGTETKYYEQRLGEKEIASGKTYRIAINLATAELYELRVLTFEDGTEGWEPYECTFSYSMMGYDDYKWVEKWSDYIPRDGQYGNGHGTYEWYDEGNTELAFIKPEIDTWWGISGHAGISDYVGTDEDAAEFTDDNMLFMIDLQAYNVAGGANDSKNFCSQYGYLDPDEYATQYSPSGVLPGLQFMDEEPRVIDHMYVTNTTYAYTIIVNGECDFGGSYEYTDESTFKIVAYGYDSFEDTEPTTTEFYLLNTGKRIVTDWTKWDLSVLGEVVRVEFNLVACYQGYGRYGLVIPAYFAYDDVAVRF